MSVWLKKYWFLFGLVMVFVITMIDISGSVAGLGSWLKHQNGPNAVIFLIFLFSGLVVDARHVRAGLGDIKGLVLALFLIFLASPLIGILIGLLPLETGVLIGIFIVAAMPTTLSSGVVMTGASGGNMAHALLITITANWLAVFTIPYALAFLMNFTGGASPVIIDRMAIMIKIGLFVLTPLAAGLIIKQAAKKTVGKIQPFLQTANQILILSIVWMAVSESRQVIMDSRTIFFSVTLVSFLFHTLLLFVCFTATRIFNIGQGKRESVIFMGAQKTLPLSIIIQVTLFPQYGTALVVCVMHHIIHLMMDGWLVGRLKA